MGAGYLKRRRERTRSLCSRCLPEKPNETQRPREDVFSSLGSQPMGGEASAATRALKLNIKVLRFLKAFADIRGSLSASPAALCALENRPFPPPSPPPPPHPKP
ncbi:hypothetical protein BESB_078620 [Besnoitia besnoiti]|uniref:Uncharacterized protein n=1 Tax=Besnoitia besnoiti TaxID=94643 RepID=A0A2A9MCI7_BESBE|nr:hypothetical protein BESB_078620 [Besnoitia besnoiti]PFH33646.1 hypothetical protein BESB_078620 [Besnoitia besnoiti]